MPRYTNLLHPRLWGGFLICGALTLHGCGGATSPSDGPTPRSGSEEKGPGNASTNGAWPEGPSKREQNEKNRKSGVAEAQGNPIAKGDPLADADLLPLGDLLVIRFDAPLSELKDKAKRGHSFGIYRDQQQPRSVQWIEERLQRVKLPTGKSTTALALFYEVPGTDSYNGWWLKLQDADWRPFEDWNVVLRMRGGKACTTKFKVELKTAERQGFAGVQMNQSQLQTMADGRFVDVAVPIGEILQDADLFKMRELVITFENNRVDVARGELLVHSIRLSPRKNNWATNGSQLLDDLARRAFVWFRENRNEKTGLVLDRSPNVPRVSRRPTMCSIASVGYYLSMLPEAVRTGQITRQKAQADALQVLEFIEEKVPHHRGLLYHFLHVETGQPLRDSEVSGLDSAIFFNGCMVAAEAFGGDVKQVADRLLDRAEWDQFIVKHPRTRKPLLALGWHAKKGLLGPMDVRSSEMAMAYFLAAGSRTNAIDAQLWYNTEVVEGMLEGRRILNPKHPLFTSYYGLGWHDLRGLRDKDGVNLEANARDAALANREFCQKVAGKDVTYHPRYGGFWGISAGDSPRGYRAPGPIYGDADGTVWPTAALAAVTWVGETIEQDLASWRRGPVWRLVAGPYGIAPFNLKKPWIGRDLIGIDLGSYYLSLANYRNETVRKLWMRHPIAANALRTLDIKKVTE